MTGCPPTRARESRSLQNRPQHQRLPDQTAGRPLWEQKQQQNAHYESDCPAPDYKTSRALESPMHLAHGAFHRTFLSGSVRTREAALECDDAPLAPRISVLPMAAE